MISEPAKLPDLLQMLTTNERKLFAFGTIDYGESLTYHLTEMETFFPNRLMRSQCLLISMVRLTCSDYSGIAHNEDP